jgi:hypothetical protein
MTQVKVFTSRVVDEFGGVFPNAILAVREFSKNTQETGASTDCVGNYVIETEVAAITYKVNYWYTEATKLEGKRSRPLIHEEDGEDATDVFVVDLEQVEVEVILESALSSHDKIMKIIESDAIRRFN